MATYSLDFNDGKEPTDVDVPEEFSTTQEDAESWINSNYMPYRDAGLAVAEEDPDHPLSGLPDWAARGFYRLAQGANIWQLRLGLDNKENAAEDIGQYTEFIKKLPYDQESIDFMANISKANDEKDIWKSLGLYWDAVAAKGGLGALTEIVGESFAMYTPTLVGAIGTSLTPAGKIGGAIVTGLGSLGIEFGDVTVQSIDKFLREKRGTDITDNKAVIDIFSNEKQMEEFTDFALKRGAPIGLADAASFGLAGKLFSAVNRSINMGERALKAGTEGAKQYSRLAKTGMLGAAAATETMAIQPFMGGLGEYAAQVVAEEDRRWGDVFVEASAEIIPGAFETMLGVAVINEEQRKISGEKIEEEFLDLKDSNTLIADAIIDDIDKTSEKDEPNKIFTMLANPTKLQKIYFTHLADSIGRSSILAGEPITPESIQRGSGFKNKQTARIVMDNLVTTGDVVATPEGTYVFTEQAEKKYNEAPIKSNNKQRKALRRLATPLLEAAAPARYVIMRESPTGYSVASKNGARLAYPTRKEAVAQKNSLLNKDKDTAKKQKQKQKNKYSVVKLEKGRDIHLPTGTVVAPSATLQTLLKSAPDIKNPEEWRTVPNSNELGEKIMLPTDVTGGGWFKFRYNTETGEPEYQFLSQNIPLQAALVETLTPEQTNTYNGNAPTKNALINLNSASLDENLSTYFNPLFLHNESDKNFFQNMINKYKLDPQALKDESNQVAAVLQYIDRMSARAVERVVEEKELLEREGGEETTFYKDKDDDIGFIVNEEILEELAKTELAKTEGTFESVPTYKNPNTGQQWVKIINKDTGDEYLDKERWDDAKTANIKLTKTGNLLDWPVNTNGKPLTPIQAQAAIDSGTAELRPVTSERGIVGGKELAIGGDELPIIDYYLKQIKSLKLGSAGSNSLASILREFEAFVLSKGETFGNAPNRLYHEGVGRNKERSQINTETLTEYFTDLENRLQDNQTRRNKFFALGEFIDWLRESTILDPNVANPMSQVSEPPRGDKLDPIVAPTPSAWKIYEEVSTERAEEYRKKYYDKVKNNIEAKMQKGDFINDGILKKNEAGEKITLADLTPAQKNIIETRFREGQEAWGKPGASDDKWLANKERKEWSAAVRSDVMLKLQYRAALRAGEVVSLYWKPTVWTKKSGKKVTDLKIAGLETAINNGEEYMRMYQPKQDTFKDFFLTQDVKNIIELWVAGTSENVLPTGGLMISPRDSSILDVERKKDLTPEVKENNLKFLFPSTQHKKKTTSAAGITREGGHVAEETYQRAWKGVRSAKRQDELEPVLDSLFGRYAKKTIEKGLPKPEMKDFHPHMARRARLTHVMNTGRVTIQQLIGLSGHGGISGVQPYIKGIDRKRVFATLKEIDRAKIAETFDEEIAVGEAVGETERFTEEQIKEQIKASLQEYAMRLEMILGSDTVKAMNLIDNNEVPENVARMKYNEYLDSKRGYGDLIVIHKFPTNPLEMGMDPHLLGQVNRIMRDKNVSMPEAFKEVNETSLTNNIAEATDSATEEAIQEAVTEPVGAKGPPGFGRKRNGSAPAVAKTIPAAVEERSLEDIFFDEEGREEGRRSEGEDSTADLNTINNIDSRISRPEYIDPNSMKTDLESIDDELLDNPAIRFLTEAGMIDIHDGKKRAEIMEAYKRKIQDIEVGKTGSIARLFFLLGRWLWHPTSFMQMHPASVPALTLLEHSRRMREATQEFILRDAHNYYNRLTHEQRHKISNVSVILNKLYPFTNTDPNYIQLERLEDGSARLVLPIAPATEPTSKKYKDKDIIQRVSVFSQEHLDRFYKVLDVQPGSIIELSPEELVEFDNVQEAFKRGYETMEGALLKSSEQTHPLYGELRISVDDTVASSVSKVRYSAIEYLKDVSNSEEFINEGINKAIANKETMDLVYFDENDEIIEENIIILKNVDQFYKHLNQIIVELETMNQAGDAPSKKMMVELDRLSSVMAGMLDVVSDTMKESVIAKKLKIASSQLKTLIHISQSQQVRNAHRYYVPQLRKGKWFFNVMRKADNTSVHYETNTPQWGDALKSEGGKAELEKRRNEMLQEYSSDLYTVTPVRERTQELIKKELKQSDLPLIHQMVVALGYKDAKEITGFVNEIQQELTTKSFGRYLRPRKKGKLGDRGGVEGYITPNNRENYLADQLAKMARTTANAASNMIFHTPIMKATEVLRSKEGGIPLAEYVDKQLEYIYRDADAGAMAKSLAFHWAIGFNFSSALVNASQPFMTTMPILKSIIGFNTGDSAMIEVLKGIQDAATIADPFNAGINRLGFDFSSKTLPDRLKGGRITQDEWAMLRNLYRKGIIQAIMNIELGSNITENIGAIESRFTFGRNGTLGRAGATVLTASAFAFAYVEQINRISAALAAYRLASRSTDMLNKFSDFSQVTEWSFEDMTPENAATMVVLKSQFLITKENRPQLFQHPLMNVATQFMSFVLQYIGLWAQSLRIIMGTKGGGTEGKTAEQRKLDRRIGSILLGGLVVTTFFAGGAMGAPWMENVRVMLKELSKTAKLNGFDLEFGMREALAEMGFGGTTVDMITRGPASHILGIDVSKRITTSEVIPYNLITGDLVTAFGPAGALLFDGMRRAKDAAQDMRQTGIGFNEPSLKFLSSFVPIGIRNGMEALHSIYDPNLPIRTLKGRVIMPSQEIGKLEHMARFIGFTPTSLRQKRLQKQYINFLEARPKAKQDYYYSQISKVLARRNKEQADGNIKGVESANEMIESLMEDIREINAEAIADKRPDVFLRMGNETLRNRLMVEMFGQTDPRVAMASARKLVRGFLHPDYLERLGLL